MENEVSYEEVASLIALNFARHLNEPTDEPCTWNVAPYQWHIYTWADYYLDYPCEILESVGVLKAVAKHTYELSVNIQLGQPINFKVTDRSAPFDCMVEMLVFLRFMDSELIARGLRSHGAHVPPEAVRQAMQASVFAPPDQIDGLRLGLNGWDDIHTVHRGVTLYWDWMEYSTVSALMRLGLASTQPDGSIRLKIEKAKGSNYGRCDKCHAFLRPHQTK
ncbi:MAG: hypothetical protein AAF557_19630 [Pseudomonadota bacterium]